jgi:SAM-dependent methyltransferase
MTDWTSGYVADIGYTYGYYAELNPMRAELALLNSQLALPKRGTACELGFGQGMSANIHAAASTTKWYGTDFNPAQAGFAQQLAESFPDGPQLHDQSFAEFCGRSDLPDFDYIGLHGIWSWISDENRGIIVDFVRRKLKVGGVLYISYNTHPGWAPMAPLRNLMAQHADVMATPGAGVLAKVDGALAFMQKLWATSPAYAKMQPQLGERLKLMGTQDRSYLAHEYFNRDWEPMSFTQMAGWLETAKLDFACSATYADHVPALHMTPEQRALLDELPDPVFRESVRDFMVGAQFRRDYWIKGARKMNNVERSERLRAHRVVMCAARAGVTLTIKGTLGESTLNQALYQPLLDLMSDYKIRSLGEIEQALAATGITISQVVQAAMILTEKSVMVAVQDDATIAAARPRTDLLNRAVRELARGNGNVNYLASPVSGIAMAVPRFPQLFISAMAEGMNNPEQLAAYVWNVLRLQGSKIVLEGVTLETAELNLKELRVQATDFLNDRVPVLRALGII